MTLGLHRLLKPRLVFEKMATVYERIERPLIEVLADMEMQGIKVDRDVLSRMSNGFAQKMAGLEAEIHEMAGRSFNVGSPKQLGELLFNELALPGGKKGKTGAYGTGADILDGLAGQGHDLPVKVLEWRQLSKLKSTYIDALPHSIDPVSGRVHTNYGQVQTSTGRLSSNDPNLQNIPVRSVQGREIRKAFIARPGWKLLSADYSQIELRIMAHLSGDKGLTTAFAEDQDIHRATASEVFDVAPEAVSDDQRRSAKAINFGIIYGISPNRNP